MIKCKRRKDGKVAASGRRGGRGYNQESRRPHGRPGSLDQAGWPAQIRNSWKPFDETRPQGADVEASPWGELDEMGEMNDLARYLATWVLRTPAVTVSALGSGPVVAVVWLVDPELHASHCSLQAACPLPGPPRASQKLLLRQCRIRRPLLLLVSLPSSNLSCTDRQPALMTKETTCRDMCTC